MSQRKFSELSSPWKAIYGQFELKPLYFEKRKEEMTRGSSLAYSPS